MKTLTKPTLLVLFWIFSSCGGAPEVAGVAGSTMLLGSLFSELTNKVNSIIQQGESSGLVLEVTAAAQLLNVVEQVRLSYDRELDKTIDSFSAVEQQTFSDISKSITQLDKGVTDAVVNVQNLMLTLPFAIRIPQIRATSGTILSPESDKHSIVFRGFFADVVKKDYEVVMKIKGAKFKPIIKDNNSIEFQISKKFFKTPDNRIEYIPCTIEIDYDKKKFFFFDERNTAILNQKLILLPPSFGEVVLETTGMEDITETRNLVCKDLVWDSRDGNNHNEIKGCDMEPGWLCDLNSVKMTVIGSEGRLNADWFDQGNFSSVGRVQWRMLTTPKQGCCFGGHDGVASIVLNYNAYSTKSVEVTKRQPPIPIKWGDKIVLQLPRNSIWKLIFKKYNGKTFEIASTKQSSPFVKLDIIKDRQITLETTPYEI